MTETVHDTGHYADDAPDVSVKTVPEKVWNPLQTGEPKIHALEVARAHGVEMSITLRPWSARHRMAYEDTAPTLQVELDQVDEDGDKLWQMRMGSLKVLGAALTIIGSTGFPQADDGRPFLVGTLEQRRADLGMVADVALFEEIIEAALEFEPLPGSTNDRKRREAARGVKADEDPSRTPPTQPQATAATDTPVSPTE